MIRFRIVGSGYLELPVDFEFSFNYNNGAVWPFVTGWVALAQYRYHNAHAGRFALDAIARTGFDEALGRRLAALHGFGAPSFGLDHDNFIGRLAQSNAAADDCNLHVP